MSNKSNSMVEKRVITTTTDNWEQLSSILFKMGVEVPINPFDSKKFVNSRIGLSLLDFNKLRDLEDHLKVLLVNKLLDDFGIKISVSSTTTKKVTTQNTSINLSVDGNANFVRFVETVKKLTPLVVTEQSEKVVEHE